MPSSKVTVAKDEVDTTEEEDSSSDLVVANSETLHPMDRIISAPIVVSSITEDNVQHTDNHAIIVASKTTM